MGQKMSNAPIYFALAQVRFNAILALDQYLPAIQDNLRKAGFPDFEKAFLGVINLAIGGGVPSQGSSIPAMQPMQPQARYTFSNEARTSGFVLDQSMMLFQTTAYDVFKAFSDDFLKGIAAVNDAATLSYSERIGVRCLDAICPRDGESLDQYLVASVKGIYDQLAPRELVHSWSETRTKEANTTLVSRTIITRHDREESVAFPPELQPMQLKVSDKFSKIKGLYGIVDTDSWLEEREKYNLPGIEKRLDALHKELRRSFDLMATPYALKVWK
jgi:uncharacterized protein (TIGR04255 family)